MTVLASIYTVAIKVGSFPETTTTVLHFPHNLGQKWHIPLATAYTAVAAIISTIMRLITSSPPFPLNLRPNRLPIVTKGVTRESFLGNLALALPCDPGALPPVNQAAMNRR